MVRKKILITGAGGFIGSVLTEYLVKKGYSVIAFDIFYFGTKPLKNVKDKIEIVKGDIRKFPKEILQDVSTIIHLASISNDPTANVNPKLSLAVNTQATKSLAIMAKEAGVKKFIFASSSSIYDKKTIHYVHLKKEGSSVMPLTVYSKSKLYAENAILPLIDRDFSVICLRQGTMFGYSPRMRYDLVINAMIKNALTTGEIRLFCKGKQWRPLMSVKDIVRIYHHLLSTPSKNIKHTIINVALNNYRIEEIGKIVQQTLFEEFGMRAQLIFDNARYTNGSYKMSLSLMKKYFGTLTYSTIQEEIISIVKNVRGEKNFENPLYYNIKTMKPLLDTRA